MSEIRDILLREKPTLFKAISDDGRVILLMHKDRQRLSGSLEEVEEVLEGLRKIGVLQDFTVVERFDAETNSWRTYRLKWL
jgi:hypothetical protein